MSCMGEYGIPSPDVLFRGMRILPYTTLLPAISRPWKHSLSFPRLVGWGAWTSIALYSALFTYLSRRIGVRNFVLVMLNVLRTGVLLLVLFWKGELSRCPR
ncbi:hypothetical protein GGR50DRAFT_101346 [Xylaria sp. CBS 124048]|nr:hypothetical protein GGR50DRAFT_101346 [Xylaria sp. CBS 124048]